MTYYSVVHSITGVSIGKWSNYEQAENFLGTLDDWQMWSVEKNYCEY